MSSVSAELPKLREEVHRLARILEANEEGLSSWWVMLGTQMKNVYSLIGAIHPDGPQGNQRPHGSELWRVDFRYKNGNASARHFRDKTRCEEFCDWLAGMGLTVVSVRLFVESRLTPTAESR